MSGPLPLDAVLVTEAAWTAVQAAIAEIVSDPTIASLLLEVGEVPDECCVPVRGDRLLIVVELPRATILIAALPPSEWCWLYEKPPTPWLPWGDA